MCISFFISFSFLYNVGSLRHLCSWKKKILGHDIVQAEEFFQKFDIYILSCFEVVTYFYWNLKPAEYRKLRSAHHFFLLRCIGWKKRERTDQPLSYAKALITAG
ncbi:unnamed protein product, partial [Pylaiella littoralis]